MLSEPSQSRHNIKHRSDGKSIQDQHQTSDHLSDAPSEEKAPPSRFCKGPSNEQNEGRKNDSSRPATAPFGMQAMASFHRAGLLRSAMPFQCSVRQPPHHQGRQEQPPPREVTVAIRGGVFRGHHWRTRLQRSSHCKLSLSLSHNEMKGTQRKTANGQGVARV